MIDDWCRLTFYDAKFSIQASDVLVFGFIAYMFSPEDALNFLALLLRTQDFLRHYRMSYSQGVWHIMQNPPFFPPQQPGIPPQNLMLPLDYNVRMAQGTVVPQRRWTPADEIDVRHDDFCLPEGGRSTTVKQGYFAIGPAAEGGLGPTFFVFDGSWMPQRAFRRTFNA